jgi:UDP-N-acetylglucosamine--N-acetylmuramyl-(pentapeptide) pyrophosphoryl-undecaprenol N-acetylglucosamine transferase
MGLLRIPSILIPIPWVTHNEQEKNALILKEAGLAEILNEGELTPEQLTVTISRFYKKEKLLDNDMIQKTFILNAGEKILESIGL